MATVFLAGHGSWATADGYTMVPRGCSIEFYTENAKNMFTNDMFDIVKGTYSGSSASKVSQFGSCPNYRLFPDNVNKTKLQQDLQAGARLYMTDDAAGKPLCWRKISGRERRAGGRRLLFQSQHYEEHRRLLGAKHLAAIAGQRLGSSGKEVQVTSLPR